MKILFRVKYHTHPGQSLGLRLSRIDAAGRREEREVPMTWLDAEHWQAEWQEPGPEIQRIEYRYVMKEEFPPMGLVEWGEAREVEADGEGVKVLVDTWRSAGSLDSLYQTKVFAPGSVPREKPEPREGDNHLIELRMAAVPEGWTPCLAGSVNELGNWNLARAVPMAQVAPDVWQASLYLPSDWWIEYKYGLKSPEGNVELELWENRVLPPHVIAERQRTKVSDEGFRRDPQRLFRGAGVAIPVFSLRGENSFGIGEFADLKDFGDWAAEAGFKLLQILPVNDTTSSHDWTDSYPYSAISVFALHPIYLRLGDLPYAMPESFHQEAAQARQRLDVLDKIDHPAVTKAKTRLARTIYDLHRTTIQASEEYAAFLRSNRRWALPYAAFCVLRDHHGTAEFWRWGENADFSWDKVEAMAASSHPKSHEIGYHLWLQMELDRQLADAAAHLRQRGLALKGDLPIGIDRESVDAWSAPHLFKMAAQAGAPPDAFAVKGQNWGFPTYDWAAMAADGYGWWRARFSQLSRYFDAYRIDHILGFFRIWQIPVEQVEGIMGWFDPALSIGLEEFAARGIAFDRERFCEPYLTDAFLERAFGEHAAEARKRYFDRKDDGAWRLKDEVRDQRRILERLAAEPDGDLWRMGLLDCASEVLFFEVADGDDSRYHPRCLLHTTASFFSLDEDQRWRIEALYNDYFYVRQEAFWRARGYEKLPAMRDASAMLLCGEDLGMVPACVPGVLDELGILSLDIQRMPKVAGIDFFDPAGANYASVVSPSTHDMPVLRAWWKEDRETTVKFAWQMLGIADPPAEMSEEIAARIFGQHLHSPAMWAIFPLQDLLAMDGGLRHPEPGEERINVPAITPYYWRYRMHLPIGRLMRETDFTAVLRKMISAAGR